MWVSNYVPHVLPRDFARSEPFSAVILLDPNRAKRACELVRLAEGPRHVDLSSSRLGKVSASNRQEFDRFLRELAARLLELAPELTSQDWDPGFLTLDLEGNSTGGRPNSSSDAKELTPVERPGTGGRDSGSNRGGSKSSNEFLRHGTRLKARASAIRKDDGIHVLISPLENATRVELRLIKRSGADGSCDMPDPPSYLAIDSKTTLNGDSIPESRFRVNAEGHAVSVDLGRVSKDAAEINVFVPTAIESAFAVDVDLVKRQPLKVKDGLDAESAATHA